MLDKLHHLHPFQRDTYTVSSDAMSRVCMELNTIPSRIVLFECKACVRLMPFCVPQRESHTVWDNLSRELDEIKIALDRKMHGLENSAVSEASVALLLL